MLINLHQTIKQFKNQITQLNQSNPDITILKLSSGELLYEGKMNDLNNNQLLQLNTNLQLDYFIPEKFYIFVVDDEDLKNWELDDVEVWHHLLTYSK